MRLDTRNEADIENEQYFNPTPSCEAHLRTTAQQVINQYQGRVHRIRLEMSVAYNCHGLTFACRRTCVHASAQVRQILEHDGYERVPKVEDVLPGDIILYVSEGDVEHSGVVIGISKNAPPLVLRYLFRALRSQMNTAAVPEPIRLAIEGTNDLDTLDRWFDAAMSAATWSDFEAGMRQKSRFQSPLTSQRSYPAQVRSGLPAPFEFEEQFLEIPAVPERVEVGVFLHMCGVPIPPPDVFV
jgi:hypothetical protein